MHHISHLISETWNRLLAHIRRRPFTGLVLGLLVQDGTVTDRPLVLSHGSRAEHIAVIGRTGTGKSSLLRYCLEQDIRDNRGFFFFDQHGDTTPHILSLIRAEERRRHQDLSGRTILINPAERITSVGLNILEASGEHERFVQVAEVAGILRERWSLDTLGVRTEELLRNALLVLQENNCTLVELAPLLTSPAFRAAALRRATHPEARAYFTDRFNRLSEPMQAIYREAVLNKVTAFTADPHFRHLIGQSRSTIDLRVALDQGFWIILNLNKGQLGEQAATLGSLILSHLKHAVFARRSRNLFTIYGDELQNLALYDTGLATLFAETRKHGVSVVSANQHLDQYPQALRSTILAVGTHVFFRLSQPDARRLAAGRPGGARLMDTLLHLPKRQMIVSAGNKPLQQAEVPWLTPPHNPTLALIRRINHRWSRPRAEVEKEIVVRQQGDWHLKGELDDWL